MPYFLLSIALILLDQIVKFWVVEHIALYAHLPFIPHIMTLTYVQNTGAAFSMLSGRTSFLALVSAVLSCILAVALYQKWFSRPLGQLSLSLILAGAVGNLIDRAFRGFVVDMFHLLFMRFAIFNVADVCVVIGGILASFYYVFLYEKYDAPPDETQEESNNPDTTNNSDTSENSHNSDTSENSHNSENSNNPDNSDHSDTSSNPNTSHNSEHSTTTEGT